MSAAHDPKLLAIDPTGCGCTECIIGEYRPLQDATDEDIQALFRGEVRDNTSEFWLIEQKQAWEEAGFEVWVNNRFVPIPSITLPLPVENYRITLYREAFEKASYDGLTLGSSD